MTWETLPLWVSLLLLAAHCWREADHGRKMRGHLVRLIERNAGRIHALESQQEALQARVDVLETHIDAFSLAPEVEE